LIKGKTILKSEQSLLLVRLRFMKIYGISMVDYEKKLRFQEKQEILTSEFNQFEKQNYYYYRDESVNYFFPYRIFITRYDNPNLLIRRAGSVFLDYNNVRPSVNEVYSQLYFDTFVYRGIRRFNLDESKYLLYANVAKMHFQDASAKRLPKRLEQQQIEMGALRGYKLILNLHVTSSLYFFLIDSNIDM